MFSKITISLLHYRAFLFLKYYCKYFYFSNFLSDLVLPNNSLSSITNNVKGIQSSKRTLKLIQYFKDKKGSTGILILQETHSNSKVEQKWKEGFKGHTLFSCEKTNYCGVLSTYFVKKTFTVKKRN